MILWINCMIGYRKKIMPHLPFLLPENKKDCKIKHIPRNNFSQWTLEQCFHILKFSLSIVMLIPVVVFNGPSLLIYESKSSLLTGLNSNTHKQWTSINVSYFQMWSFITLQKTVNILAVNLWDNKHTRCIAQDTNPDIMSMITTWYRIILLFQNLAIHTALLQVRTIMGTKYV